MAFGKRRKKGTPMDETNQTQDDVDKTLDTDAEETQETADQQPPMSELDAACAARDEFEQKWLRAQADFQNLRRRTAADIDSAVTRAKSEVLAEAVTVLDYLDMALAAPVTTDEAKNLKVGVEMTRGQLQGLFDRLNVKPIDASGIFDPTLHQAVSTVETDEHEPGTIVEVVRAGWSMGEDVLRYAQVRVAAASEPESADAPEEGDSPQASEVEAEDSSAPEGKE